MKQVLCDLKIIPEKDKKIAQINIILLENTWFEINETLNELFLLLPKNIILQHSILEQKTFFIEIQYDALENITKIIERFINSNHILKIHKKQIFIKKLGGWFDF